MTNNTLIPSSVLLLIVSPENETTKKNYYQLAPNRTPLAKHSSILFTVRSNKVEHHRGQISFPGGVHESHDPTRLATALRETHEETGIDTSKIEIAAELPEFPTRATPFLIKPYVGVIRINKIENMNLKMNSDEIAEHFFVPIEHLINPSNHKIELISRGTFQYKMKSFYFNGHRIWGATGFMVESFLEKILIRP